MTTVAVFAGTRPEIIKLAPVIWALMKSNLGLLFVHTGQHYDSNMSKQFITELNLPEPHRHLDVGSSTQGVQTARVLERAEAVLIQEGADLVVVEGDTNSALSVALASAKLGIPLGHVEAGCRCYDKAMPEELNRMIVADCATLHFAATKNCVDNLLREGIDPSAICLTGHPIVDVIANVRGQVDSSKILSELNLDNKSYVLLTVHRVKNSDNLERMRNIMQAVEALDIPVVFPVHPRTQRNLKQYSIPLSRNLIPTKPLSYFDTLRLVRDAYVVFTDSGGIQQEACLLHTPCITLRDRTEWIETVEAGVNMLADADKTRILGVYMKLQRQYNAVKEKFKQTDAVFGRGDASQKILQAIRSFIYEHEAHA